MNRSVRLVLRLAVWASVVVHPLAAQRAVIVPESARKLVVQVLAEFPPSTDPNVTPEPGPTPGSGIILGRGSDNVVLIATAGHVVRRTNGDSALSVRLFLYPDTLKQRPVAARVLRVAAGDMDLAVLAAPLSVLSTLGLRSVDFERQGEDDRLQRGELVKGVGCPNQQCWGMTDPELRFLVSEGEILLFDPRGIHGGDSGGALFDVRGEILGMVISQDEFRSRALRITSITDQLDRWTLDHQFRPSRYPRRGYASSAGAMLLTGERSGRAPGVRSTVEMQLGTLATWHFGVLRQTGANVGLSSGIVGASLALRRNRVVVAPFAEVGLGQIDAQYDAGGYYVAAPSGNAYVPYWRPVQGSAIGGGGGVTAQVYVLPRLAVEALVARWKFNTPELAPDLPRSTIGVGLRWGVRR